MQFLSEKLKEICFNGIRMSGGLGVSTDNAYYSVGVNKITQSKRTSAPYMT